MACCVGRGDWYTSAQWSQAMLRTLMSKRPRVPTSMPLELTPHTGQRGISVAWGRNWVTPVSSKVQARQARCPASNTASELREFADFGAGFQASASVTALTAVKLLTVG